MRALVLSGGGAKGSFELGALKYLYRSEFGPEIICGTSVGSVNAAKLAEGEIGGTYGLSGLEQIWLGLNYNSDMYQMEDWVEYLHYKIKGAINSPSSNRGWTPSIQLTVIEWAALNLLPFAAAEQLVHLLTFFNGLATKKSLFHLGPIEAIAHAQLDLAQIAGNGIRLRMAVVGLESGKLRYVTESGRLVDAANAESDDPAAPLVGVIPGMLASAAIPGVFRPQKLAGEWYVDGGVREIVPIQAALDMGASEVFSLVSPARAQPSSYTFERSGVLEIGGRAVDLLTDEILKDEIASMRRNPWVFVIQPLFEVHDTKYVDPGLIRINSAYGYMSAFDALEQLSPPLRTELGKLSNVIATTRKRVWEAENAIFFMVLQLIEGEGNLGLQLAVLALYRQLRDDKNRLRGMFECRQQLGGFESMDHIAVEWWTEWERHPPRQGFGLPMYQGPTGFHETMPATPWEEFTFEIWSKAKPSPLGSREQPETEPSRLLQTVRVPVLPENP